MATPIDPNSLMFLLAESRSQPMHVAGMQLFEPPADAGPDFAANIYEKALLETEVAPLFKKRPYKSIKTAGQWTWTPDEQFDVEHHLRRSALPSPGRVRELLELVGRLHGTTLDRERPLWESHVIEGMTDGRMALYTKIHHSLVDGVAATRLMQSVLSTDPDKRDMPMPFAANVPKRTRKVEEEAQRRLADLPLSTARSAASIAMDAAGLPAAFVRTLNKG
ncbi:MAG TPA: wax ester/triacylglycerol synthase domain-containing protein, partial [Marmoricola sp.]|nr:wax ester/triacylglycerol synthase domain-containing protein [Marmoricola sp.]